MTPPCMIIFPGEICNYFTMLIPYLIVIHIAWDFVVDKQYVFFFFFKLI